jgi:YggT family protein
MRPPSVLLAVLAFCFTSSVSASVFLPYNMKNKSTGLSPYMSTSKDFSYGTRQRLVTHKSAAMAIPGYGVAEQVFVGGFSNFLSIYNIVITARILLSWFPQAQGIGLLQPVYAITDPYLNIFRGVIPPVFGLDLSPLAAFFLLNVLTNATAALGAEIPEAMQKKLKNSPFGRAASRGSFAMD